MHYDSLRMDGDKKPYPNKMLKVDEAVEQHRHATEDDMYILVGIEPRFSPKQSEGKRSKLEPHKVGKIASTKVMRQQFQV